MTQELPTNGMSDGQNLGYLLCLETSGFDSHLASVSIFSDQKAILAEVYARNIHCCHYDGDGELQSHP